MAAESQMMGRTPAFYSPLHSMAWAGAFGAASSGSSGEDYIQDITSNMQGVGSVLLQLQLPDAVA